jgi:hypothetical protein
MTVSSRETITQFIVSSEESNLQIRVSNIWEPARKDCVSSRETKTQITVV